MSDTKGIVTDADSKITCQRSVVNTITHSGFKNTCEGARRRREVPSGQSPPEPVAPSYGLIKIKHKLCQSVRVSPWNASRP
jgi:hypothetical protein